MLVDRVLWSDPDSAGSVRQLKSVMIRLCVPAIAQEIAIATGFGKSRGEAFNLVLPVIHADDEIADTCIAELCDAFRIEIITIGDDFDAEIMEEADDLLQFGMQHWLAITAKRDRSAPVDRAEILGDFLCKVQAHV